jgi:hypothetical protein
MFEPMEIAVAALGRAWAVTVLAMTVLVGMVVLSQVDGAVYYQNFEAGLMDSD